MNKDIKTFITRIMGVLFKSGKYGKAHSSRSKDTSYNKGLDTLYDIIYFNYSSDSLDKNVELIIHAFHVILRGIYIYQSRLDLGMVHPNAAGDRVVELGRELEILLKHSKRNSDKGFSAEYINFIYTMAEVTINQAKDLYEVLA
jgi:hypothetical protein